ncbi:hypothetical protein Droror1_Dr00017906 [Drosera rotundifolia]
MSLVVLSIELIVVTSQIQAIFGAEAEEEMVEVEVEVIAEVEAKVEVEEVLTSMIKAMQAQALKAGIELIKVKFSVTIVIDSVHGSMNMTENKEDTITPTDAPALLFASACGAGTDDTSNRDCSFYEGNAWNWHGTLATECPVPLTLSWDRNLPYFEAESNDEELQNQEENTELITQQHTEGAIIPVDGAVIPAQSGMGIETGTRGRSGFAWFGVVRRWNEVGVRRCCGWLRTEADPCGVWSDFRRGSISGLIGLVRWWFG